MAIKLHFPSGKFYENGKQKKESLQTLLQREVVVFDTLLCAKLQKFLIRLNILLALCSLSIYPSNKRKNIVLKEKYCCISIGEHCPPMSLRVKKEAPSVLQVNLSPNLTVFSCITNDNQHTLLLIKEEKTESRGQSILRKQQTLYNITEDETLQKIFHWSNIFTSTMSLQKKMKRLYEWN